MKDREFVVKQRRELKKRVEERQKERSDVIAKTSSSMNVEDEEKLRKTLLESKVRFEKKTVLEIQTPLTPHSNLGTKNTS